VRRNRAGQLIMTVGEQGGITFPVGPGIGATHAEKVTISPILAAGLPWIITLVEPIEIMPGPFGTHEGSVQGLLMLPTTAAGRLLIITVGTVAPTIVSGIGG
jgi:hypothetical protein